MTYESVGQFQQAAQPSTTGLAMRRRNPLAVWLGLPLITLGIYELVWYYKIHKEMAEYHRKPDAPVAGPLLVLILLGWTVIGAIATLYKTGERIRYAQRRAGLEETCSPVVGTLLVFVFGLGIMYYQTELNKIVDRDGVPAGTPVPLHGQS
ncbi:DUF4234 domain-containing protein [Actinocrispum wychmicini]|uniref:Uncharacterized protein DUF4234 n=1 Tax=Actinocrispum wychmicini TaxID=1213861 RepID=A0A4R2J9L2_9PSEU|nr:DUF4234 domain-containing protein [Actinocrispum wychmicini]TCO56023.1 uncharacterized protein DUF4234 [Actinocrispum wychmicini]